MPPDYAWTRSRVLPIMIIVLFVLFVGLGLLNDNGFFKWVFG